MALLATSVTSTTSRVNALNISEQTPIQDKTISTIFHKLLGQQENVSNPLLGDVDFTYLRADSPLKKRALICYCLYSQHYNAELTLEENKSLHYSTPLCAVQADSGYVRTEHGRLLELVKPWIEKYLHPFFQNSFWEAPNPIDFIRLTDSSAISVLKYFSPHQIVSLEKVCSESTQSNDLRLVPIEILPQDLNKKASEILTAKIKEFGQRLNLGTIRKNQQLRFLFQLKNPTVDCVIIWIAKWQKPKQNSDLCVESFKSLFGKEILSLLNSAGAVPDRMALNEFLAQSIEYTEFELTDTIRVDYQSILWPPKWMEMTGYDLSNDPGSEVYRDAIILWNSTFFKPFELLPFAAPLLNSQVLPGLGKGADIVIWSKAYQNLCEIVLLCIQSFPDKFESNSFEKSLLKSLDENEDLDGVFKRAGLFSYGMSAAFYTLDIVLSRFQDQKITVTTISRNYFEILDILEKKDGVGHVKCKKVERLNEIVGRPDVLVADIHPNDATQKTLSQNDVGTWVQKYLEDDENAKLILVLDVTLNHFKDPTLQTLLKKFAPYIKESRLEIFLIQSLAKLIQLGADNFSGGACVYLGYPGNQVPSFQPPLHQKGVFFGHLICHFQELTDRYFALVRKNTEWMYQRLMQRFKAVTEWVHEVEAQENSEPKWKGFCAAKIALNVDQNTVYVAINFSPLLDRVRVPNLVSEIRSSLLQLARVSRLPLTGRQSFGFSLSNLSEVPQNAIRLSVGVEDVLHLEQYVELISAFVFSLSYMAVNTPEEIKTLGTQVDTIDQIITGKKSCEIIDIPLGFNIPRNFKFWVEGKAEIVFQDGKMKLLPEPDLVIDQKQIGLPSYDEKGEYTIRSHHWGPFDFVQILLQVVCCQCTLLRVLTPAVASIESPISYGIARLFRDRGFFDLSASGKVVDPLSSDSIVYTPKFEVTLANGTLIGSDHVYVDLKDPAFDDIIENVSAIKDVPVQISKLDFDLRKQVFSHCFDRNLEFCERVEEKGTYQIQFGNKKERIDYATGIFKILYGVGGFDALVEHLNGLDYEKLPLSVISGWDYPHSPIDSLCNVVSYVGQRILDVPSQRPYEALMKLENKRLRNAILHNFPSMIIANCSYKSEISIPQK